MEKQFLTTNNVKARLSGVVILSSALANYSCQSGINENNMKYFSLVKSTQNAGTTLKIENRSDNLEISIVRRGTSTPVVMGNINGLRRCNNVPREFFDSTYATVYGDTVSFVPTLKGGGKQETESLLKALKMNLTNDYDEELSEEDIHILLDAFSKMIELKQEKGATPEELQAFVTKELGQYENREELGNAFQYMLKRAEGKYGFFSFMFFGMARLIFSWFGW